MAHTAAQDNFTGIQWLSFIHCAYRWCRGSRVEENESASQSADDSDHESNGNCCHRCGGGDTSQENDCFNTLSEDC